MCGFSNGSTEAFWGSVEHVFPATSLSCRTVHVLLYWVLRNSVGKQKASGPEAPEQVKPTEKAPGPQLAEQHLVPQPATSRLF